MLDKKCFDLVQTTKKWKMLAIVLLKRNPTLYNRLLLTSDVLEASGMKNDDWLTG